jgi:hypothetical protein
MERKNVLKEKSIAFALRIVNAYQFLTKEKNKQMKHHSAIIFYYSLFNIQYSS